MISLVCGILKSWTHSNKTMVGEMGRCCLMGANAILDENERVK